MSTEISLSDKCLRRGAHVVFYHCGHLHVWGGILERVDKVPRGPNRGPTNGNDLHSTDEMCLYDPSGKRWKRIPCSGQCPPRGFGCAFVRREKFLYVFGGHHCYTDDPGYVDGNNNKLFECNLNDYRWSEITSTGVIPSECEGASLSCRGSNLYLFGGYGPPEPQQQDNEQEEFTVNPHCSSEWVRGWDAHLLSFDLFNKVWRRPKTKGRTPSPRAGHASLILLDKLLVIFGGREQRRRLNDVHVLDLEDMMWLKVNRIKEESTGPEARSIHTLTAICRNKAFLYGGLGALGQPLNDAWLLHITSCQDGEVSIRWSEVALPYDHGQVRCWHGACYAQEADEVIVHSGLTQEWYLNRIQLDDHAEDLLTLRMGVNPQSLLRTALEAVVLLINSSKTITLEELQKILPTNLALAAMSRLSEVPLGASIPAPEGEEPFDRNMFHEGV